MERKPARRRVQAMAQGRGQTERLAIPLAFDVAACISARPLDAFHHDPTELANGLSELQRAIGSEAVCCALADNIEWRSAAGGPLDPDALIAPGTPLAASLEACRRLRATAGDALALVAGLSGPATLAARFGVTLTTAGEAFATLVKTFCGAGTDVVLVFEDSAIGDQDVWNEAVRTAGNIARFHRALAVSVSSSGALPVPAQCALEAPVAGDAGLTLTQGIVAADADLGLLKTWVATVGAA